MTDTNHFNDTAYYGNLDPLILYGDTWLYGAALPNANIGVPTNVYVLHEKEYNIISWEAPKQSGIKGYRILRSKTIGHADTKIVAEIFNQDSTGNPYTCYLDYLLDSEVDTQFYYAIASINDANFISFSSEWAADINLDNSFTSKKYLYTDQLTQSYWSIIDLYKQLGNIDTDRNIIPFRDRGNTYVQVNVNSQFPDMFLSNESLILRGNLKNKSDVLPGYLTNLTGETSLEKVNVPVKINCNYLYVTELPVNDIKTYTFYMDNIPIVTNKSSITLTAIIYENDDNANLSNLQVDKRIFSSQVSESGTYDFYWNDVLNCWQINAEEVDLTSFGISFEGTPMSKNIISVDFNKVGYVYFRVPYVYDSKVLQTYIKSEDGIIYNEFTFKTYNHLIFASTLGKIFNNIQLILRETKGNLYTTDVSDPYVYKNFASYFNFEQPAWLNNTNYRRCVLGNSVTGDNGLWQAAMSGGTKLGLQQAVEALASGNFTMSSTVNIDYLTMYDSFKELSGSGLNLTSILNYSPTDTYSTDDIILYDNNYYKVKSGNTNITINISNTVPVVNEFTDISSTKLECVNQDFKNALFKKVYNNDSSDLVNYDPINITVLTDTEQITCTKYKLVNIDSKFYEVRKQFDYFYVILMFSNNEPSSYGVANGSFYYNTYTKKLYKIENGAWVESDSDLRLNAIYFNKDDSNLYCYNGTDLVVQTILRPVDKICNILKYTIPLELWAIYELIGSEYYLINLQLPSVEKDYIFLNNYTEDSITDPISYTHQYVIDTYEIEFDNWKRETSVPEKYLVYGNTLKLNNQNIIYPSPNFIVYADEANTDVIPVAAYSVDASKGILTWQDTQFKPNDGSYVYISYIVDIRSDIKNIINLFKFPQTNIRYLWVEE